MTRLFHLPHLKSRAWWIAAGYATFATLWIYYSDQTLNALIHNPEMLVKWSVHKGLGFVAVTSLLLLLMMRWAFGTIEENYTNLKAHEVEIERLKQLYAALSQINQAIVWTPSRDELFQKICTILTEHGGFRMAWIGWHDEVNHLLLPVAHSGDEIDYLSNIKIYTDDRPEGRGPSGEAFRQGLPYICNDLHKDPITLPWRTDAQQRGLHASAAFPIRVRGQIKGTLNVYASSPDFFQEKEQELLVGAATDISFALDNLIRDEERKSAEAIAARESLFSRTMIESMPGILYFYNEQGKFLRWNANFEKVSGYSGREIAQMHPLDFFTSADQRPLQKRIAEVFEHGESHIESLFLAKDGSKTPYFFTGRRVEFDGMNCLVGVGIDISERVQAEDAQRASEARYRTLFEYAPDGILIADSQSNYIDGNTSICQMLGYTHEELVGKHASDIVSPSEESHIGTALNLIQKQTEYHREWVFRRKDGSTFPADVIATVMPDGNLLGMVRDITERHEAEKTLKELNESLELKVAERTTELKAALIRAEAADKLKSAFLATMSHELRTPLNSIIGFTGILLQGLAGPLNPEQNKQMGMVRGSARHLLELINDVLDLSKIEAGQLEIRSEPFHLPESIERVVASVHPLADKKGLTLHTDIAADLGMCTGDRRRLEQILINLLNNAIKFTDKGHVQLTAERCPNFAVCIRVKDTGIGIKPLDLTNLFQPFRQIDTGLSRQHEGTGLGLAICRRLISLMGGEISASSEWGQGSEFTVKLPLQS